MLVLKPRAGLLGMLAMLLIGLFASAPAEAQGPFWYHRESGQQIKGVKISAQKPEEVRGGGGEVILEGKLAGAEIELAAKQVQVKGIIYNNASQGQAKLEFAYFQPRAIKPSTCNVTIGKNNIVKVYGHLVWKWDGSKAQLEEQPQKKQKPDWMFLGQELDPQAEGLPEVPFTAITLSGPSCPVPGTAAVEGNVAAGVKPPNVEEFSMAQTAEVLPVQKQHRKVGGANVGFEAHLKFNNEPATLKQSNTVSTFGHQGSLAQEVALYEE